MELKEAITKRHVIRDYEDKDVPDEKLLQVLEAADSQISSKGSFDYIDALREDSLFNEGMITSEAATNISSDLGALEFAIGIEKDSVLFYYEIRELLPQQSHPTINQVIKEEKSHVWQLSEIKKRLSIIR